jgi:circadian clock protein KaiC
MTTPKPAPRTATPGTQLPKAPTGIRGLDEITGGGLPHGRPTLVCGGAGSGKTLLAMEFVVRGATQFNEPGVFMSFEETARDLTQNVASLGFDLDQLVASKRLVLDFVLIDRSEWQEAGQYDLEGLFIRLGHAIDSIAAKRVVLDTVDALFANLPDHAILRAELGRLFRWLKQRGVTTIVTGERGTDALTRHGLEEYVSDCVIILDQRIRDQVSSRQLRVLKYRGSPHGTNEYPFLIGAGGITVLPITSLGLQQATSTGFVPTGVERLDVMMGGHGYYRGSSVLVSGTSGTGKSSLAAHFADAACRRGERAIYFSFEEAPSQIIRNMRSIGIDLEPWVTKGLLQFHASRPTLTGLEVHLAMMCKAVALFKPQVVVVDPISSFIRGDNQVEVKAMLMRLIDFLKTSLITSLLTNLNQGGGAAEHTEVVISSLMDTWLLLKNIEAGGERNRGLYIMKSRGMAHSNQIREFLLTDHGVVLRDVYVGASGILTGSARLTQEAQEQAARVIRGQDVEQRRVELEHKRTTLEAQVALLRAEFAAEEAASLKLVGREKLVTAQLVHDSQAMGLSRKADATPGSAAPGPA